MKSFAVLFILLAVSITGAKAQATANSFLCRAQLDMLVDRERVTETERAVFEKQCACLEDQEKRTGTSDLKTCSEGGLDQ